MAYVVLARKYRPRTFKEFIGQDAIGATLANSIETDRVAHAYLFCGPRGVGKTSMARVFAKALNCKDGPTPSPCGECEICKTIATGSDVDVIEIDGASNRGIDEVREIRQNAKYSPGRSRYKIYIIDEVHMLTEPAFNALLKTLEEPPPHVKFILATTAPAKLPETIHSRLQRFTFRRVDVKTLSAHLENLCEKEGAPVNQDVLALVSRQARGSVRDALSMLDQTLAFCGADLTLERAAACLGALSEGDLWRILDGIAEDQPADVIASVDEYIQRGVGVEDILQQITNLMRDLMVAGHCGADADLLGRAQDSADAVAQRAKLFDAEALAYMIQMLCEASRRVREEVDSRVILEMTLIKLCRHKDIAPVQTLLDRLASIEKRLVAPAGGASARPRPRPGPAAESGPIPTRPSRPAATPETARPQPKQASAPLPADTPPPVSRVSEDSPEAPTSSDPGTVWDTVLADVKETLWVHMLVSHASLVELNEDSATVRFPRNLASQCAECETASVRDRIESAFQKALGRRIHARFDLAAVADTEQVTQDAIRHDPIIRAAVELFDGTIMRIHKEEPDEAVETPQEGELA